MFRSIIRFSLLLLLFLILFMLMLSAGWIQIQIKTSEISSDMKTIGNGMVTQATSESELKYDFIKNRLFKFESHIVNPGETLFDLERSYGANWKVIQRINKIENPLRLTTGAIIWIPVRIPDSWTFKFN